MTFPVTHMLVRATMVDTVLTSPLHASGVGRNHNGDGLPYRLGGFFTLHRRFGSFTRCVARRGFDAVFHVTFTFGAAEFGGFRFTFDGFGFARSVTRFDADPCLSSCRCGQYR